LKLIRSIKKGNHGPDVLALKRALKRAKVKAPGLVLNRRFGRALDKAVRRFQKLNGLPADGVYGERTHRLLAPFFDPYGRRLLRQAPKFTPQEERFNRLLSYMEKITRDTPGYLYGGGHGPPLSALSTRQALDCSSSTSLALDHEGMFNDDYAWVSGTFAYQYGQPGRGKFFTVYANGEHVWVRLHKGPYWRFDTSPHGDGGRGPRLRKLPRFTGRFAARHWPGM
jgi:peptidoglycan hydrolase-like protein with peptidoglycan-binding domain